MMQHYAAFSVHTWPPPFDIDDSMRLQNIQACDYRLENQTGLAAYQFWIAQQNYELLL
jgi:hypothetical protein